jgi:hypothetical protein
MAPRVDAPTLRSILGNAVDMPDDPFDAARRYTRHLLGSAASHITWRHVGEPDGYTGVHGELRDVLTYDRIRLRFKQPDPGNVQLLARIPCPSNPACLWAFDTVTDRGDLLAILDGADDLDHDPHCLVHSPGH